MMLEGDCGSPGTYTTREICAPPPFFPPQLGGDYFFSPLILFGDFLFSGIRRYTRFRTRALTRARVFALHSCISAFVSGGYFIAPFGVRRYGLGFERLSLEHAQAFCLDLRSTFSIDRE